MSKLTIEQIVAAREALKTFGELKLPMKAAVEVLRLFKKVSAECEHFDKLKTDLMRELGEEREPNEMERALGYNQTVIAVKPEHMAEYQTRISELLCVEVDLEFKPLDLNTCGDVEVKPATLQILTDSGLATL